MVTDLRSRIQSLEKHVQTQRERYCTLLEETDNLIRSRGDRSRKVSSEEGWREGHAVLNVCFTDIIDTFIIYDNCFVEVTL